MITSSQKTGLKSPILKTSFLRSGTNILGLSNKTLNCHKVPKKTLSSTWCLMKIISLKILSVFQKVENFLEWLCPRPEQGGPCPRLPLGRSKIVRMSEDEDGEDVDILRRAS